MKQQSTKKQKGTDKQQLSGVHNIENTPFNIVNKEGEVTLLWGMYVVKNEFKDVEEAKKYVADDSWELRMTIMSIMVELYDNAKNNK